MSSRIFFMGEPGIDKNLAAIGIDLGGTKTEALLLAPDGSVLHRLRRATPREEGYEAIVAQVAGMVKEATAALPPGSPYTVGIGIPGSLNPVTGLVRNANSTCLIGHPLKNDLEQLLGHAVTVRNDADCFTLAECRAGASQGLGLVFGVIMGTGCGGGICIDGEVREGPHRIAGEWGHYSVDPNGADCYCGNRGCVETLISGSGMEAAFFREFGEMLSMDEIVTLARAGEERCRAVFDHFLDNFGRCLGGLISILDPDAVVLGGGLSNIDELYTEGVERVRRYAFHEGITTPILKNRLGDSAGVFGAAWIGMRAASASSPKKYAIDYQTADDKNFLLPGALGRTPESINPLITRCPTCGGSDLGWPSLKNFQCRICGFVLYLNTAAAVAVIMECRGKILFGVRKHDPGRGMLDLPGGFADPGETMEEAARREVMEELGIEIPEMRYLFSFPNIYPYRGMVYYTLDMIFLARWDEPPQVTADEDLEEIIWVELDKIEYDRIAFDSLRRGVRSYLAWQEEAGFS